MNIQLNGEEYQLPDGATAAQLIEQLGFQGRRLAMEVNMEIVPRSTYETHQLQADDQVELVQAIGGG